MIYKVGEWGEVTEFTSLTKALKYCKEKNIGPTDDNGLLWLYGTSRKEMDEFRRTNKKFDEEYMRLTYEGRSTQYIWCDVYKKWYDYDKYYDSNEDLD